MGRYAKVRMDFGVDRMQLGACLHLIKEHSLWRGRADSWEAFLADENLNPNAARQYIKVARKFIFDLDLPQETLRKLAAAGISALEKAAHVITAENQDAIIGSLTALSERDAVQRIIELSAQSDPAPHLPTIRVLALLRQYHDLPPDLQLEFKQRLQGKSEQRAPLAVVSSPPAAGEASKAA